LKATLTCAQRNAEDGVSSSIALSENFMPVELFFQDVGIDMHLGCFSCVFCAAWFLQRENSVLKSG